MDVQRLEVLENLVEELMKSEPREDLVKQYMRETGIKYSVDPIERLNLVLRALHFDETDSKKETAE